MQIHTSRDSVAAGDDADAPHSRDFSVRDAISLSEALTRIQREYLPTISGGLATWSVTSNVPVAVLAQQWSQPKMILTLPEAMRALDIRKGILHLHFNYHTQLDPELVHEVLRRLQLNAS